MSLPPLKTSTSQDPESYLSVYYQISAWYLNTTIRLFGLILSRFRFELSRLIITYAAKVYYIIRGQPNVYDSSDLQLQHIASLIGTSSTVANYSHWNTTSFLKDYISVDAVLRDVMSFDIRDLIFSFRDVTEHVKLSQFEFSSSEFYGQSDGDYASDNCLSVLFRHSEYDIRHATNTLHLTNVVSIQSLRRALTDKDAVDDKKTNEYLAKVGAYALYTLVYARMRQEFGREYIMKYASDHLSVRALASLIVEKQAHAFVKGSTSSSYSPNQVFASVALALYGAVFKGGGWPVLIDYHNNHLRLFKSL